MQDELKEYFVHIPSEVKDVGYYGYRVAALSPAQALDKAFNEFCMDDEVEPFDDNIEFSEIQTTAEVYELVKRDV